MGGGSKKSFYNFALDKRLISLFEWASIIYVRTHKAYIINYL